MTRDAVSNETSNYLVNLVANCTDPRSSRVPGWRSAPSSIPDNYYLTTCHQQSASLPRPLCRSLACMKTPARKINALLRAGNALFESGDWIGAAVHYFDAGTLGSAEGYFMLGVMHADDLFGDFLRDDKLAAKFFLLAADLGNTHAQMRIADMYANGCGVAKNREKADRYWRAAAESGDVDAQDMYAAFLFYDAPDDLQRKKDVRAATRWFNAALKQGSSGANIALRHIRRWKKDGYLPDLNVDIEKIFDQDRDPDEDFE